MDNRRLFKMSLVLAVFWTLFMGLMVVLGFLMGDIVLVIMSIPRYIIQGIVWSCFPFGWVNADKFREKMGIRLVLSPVGWAAYFIVKLLIAAFTGWFFFLKALKDRDEE